MSKMTVSHFDGTVITPVTEFEEVCLQATTDVSNNVLIKVTLSRQRHCRGTVKTGSDA